MAKYTVWQCDRCGKQMKQEAPPPEWKAAEIKTPQESPNFIFSDKKVWCGGCWADIKQMLPQVKEVPHAN